MRLGWAGPVAAATVAVAVAGAVVALRRRVFVVRVRGLSMSPTYGDGELVVMVRSTRLARGDVVAFRQPTDDGGPAVKRVAGLAGDGPAGEPVPPGHVFLVGDAGRSLDSTVYGPVALDRVIGRAVRPRSGGGGRDAVLPVAPPSSRD